jgi:hypothetical protein
MGCYRLFIPNTAILKQQPPEREVVVKLLTDYLPRKRKTAAPRATTPRRTSGRTPPKKYPIAISRNNTIMNQVAIEVGNFILHSP